MIVKITAATLAAFAVSWPAVAMDFNDYAVLFADHPAAVTETRNADGTVARTLEMPPGVVVTEQPSVSGSLRYSAYDRSGLGAVGCVLLIVVDIKSIGVNCPGALSADQIARLDGPRESIGAFVAKNSYPPVAEDEIRAAVERRIKDRVGLICPGPGGDLEFVRAFADLISDPEAEMSTNELL